MGIKTKHCNLLFHNLVIEAILLFNYLLKTTAAENRIPVPSTAQHFIFPETPNKLYKKITIRSYTNPFIFPASFFVKKSPKRHFKPLRQHLQKNVNCVLLNKI
jgi:hypothetical protein